jgi:hypothetical protein
LPKKLPSVIFFLTNKLTQGSLLSTRQARGISRGQQAGRWLADDKLFAAPGPKAAGGREDDMFPTVTQILRPWQDFSGIPPEVLARAAERGSMVHRACSAMIQGLWFNEALEDCYGYVESFTNWVATVNPEVIAAEIELKDHNLRFMGHPDLICKIGQDVIVIDLKTSATPAPSWRLQLAAYHHLVAINLDNPPKRAAALRLSKDGKAAMFDEYTATLATDFAVFLNCLSAFKYFRGGNS